MFYVVGYWDGYVWIFDARDNSCECVEEKDFIKMRESGIKFVKGERLLFNKLLMTSNLPSFESFMYTYLVKYNIKFHISKDLYTKKDALISLFFFRHDILDEKVISNVVRNQGYADSVYCFLQIDVEGVRGLNSVIVASKRNSERLHLYDRLLHIPTYQVPWLLSIREHKDFDLLRSAVCEIGFDKAAKRAKLPVTDLQYSFTDIDWVNDFEAF